MEAKTNHQSYTNGSPCIYIYFINLLRKFVLHNDLKLIGDTFILCIGKFLNYLLRKENKITRFIAGVFKI